MLGRWDEALAAFAEVPEDRLLAGLTEGFLSSLPEIHIARGELGRAVHLLSLFAPHEDSANVQSRVYYMIGAAVVARAEGRLDDALRIGSEATRLSRYGGEQASQATKLGVVEAIEAALTLSETQRAEELVASIEAVPPGLRAPYLTAQALRFRGRLAGSDDSAVERYEAAANRFRELKIPFWLAVTQLEHGELTGDVTRIDEAREIFEGLGARSWVERVSATATESRANVPA
jgi:hypothetical protein